MSSNKRNAFSSLGAKTYALSEREPTDFYATDPQALEIFLEILKQDGIILPHKICDQTTPNMIQGLKGIFARKPLISRGI